MNLTTGGVLRNSAAVFGGTLLQKLVGLYTLRVLATQMDRIAPHMFGDWNTVFIFLGFFGVVADFNLEALVVRELNRPDRDHGVVLGNAILLKLGLAAAAVLLATAVVWLAPYPLSIKKLVTLAALSLPFSVVTLYRSACQARLKSHITQSFNLVGNAVFLLVVLVLVHARSGLVWFVAAQAFVAQPINVAFILRARRVVRPVFEFDPALCRRLFRTALPIGVALMITMVSYRFDALYLYSARGSQEVGLYAAGYRLTEAFSFLPGAVIGSVYPVLAGLAAGERERLRLAFSLTARWLLILALPLLIVTTLFSHLVVRWMYGPAYAPTAAALRWLGLAEFLMFFSPLMYHLLLALDQDRRLFQNSMTYAAFNVAANIALVGRFGFVACAAVTAATEAVAILMAIWQLRHSATLRPPDRAHRILAAAIFSALLSSTLRPAAFGPAAVVVLSTYLGALVLTSALTREDIAFLIRALRK